MVTVQNQTAGIPGTRRATRKPRDGEPSSQEGADILRHIEVAEGQQE